MKIILPQPIPSKQYWGDFSDDELREFALSCVKVALHACGINPEIHEIAFQVPPNYGLTLNAHVDVPIRLVATGSGAILDSDGKEVCKVRIGEPLSTAGTEA